MRSGVVLALVLAACGFHSGGRGDDVPDAAMAGAPDSPAAPAFCDPADVHVAVCYEFEGNAVDQSHNHVVTTPDMVLYSTGKVGMAMALGIASTVDAADNLAFDVGKLTVEAWVQPSLLPASGTAFIVDVDQQYALTVDGSGNMKCILFGGYDLSTPSVGPRVAAGQWMHVACTYDPVNGSVLYLDGAIAASLGPLDALETGGTGMSIGSDHPGHGAKLLGLIDQLRIMDVVRTAAEICADAGKSSCP